MLFSQLAQTLADIEAVTSRLGITKILADLWAKLSDQEIWPTANLVQGRLRPPYDNLVFNVSEKLIAKSLVAWINLSGGWNGTASAVDLFGQADDAAVATKVKQLYRQCGDWGETAATLSRQLAPDQHSQLQINDVYQALTELAQAEGVGAQHDKTTRLAQLYRQVDANSAKIITRIVIGKLRLGFSTKTLLDSLSWAVTGSKAESNFLEEIWQKKADVGLLAGSYLALAQRSATDRQKKLSADYRVSCGIPVVPALCQRLDSTTEMIDKMTRVIAEPKYDGLRIQIHVEKKNGHTNIFAFTRNLDNVTAMFPELQTLAEALPVQAAIFDSEAVGFNAQTGEMLPFQETISRRRLYDIDEKAKTIKIRFFTFDCLYLDGQELLTTPLDERKKILARLIPAHVPAIVTDYIVSSDPDELRTYHQTQLAAGLEGMVVKGIHSRYQSGRKGWNWVKIKEQEGTRGKLNDTLDLVVMGVYSGRGKRHELGVGAFLTGVRDQNGDIFTITKIGTGLTDQDLTDLSQKAEKLAINVPPPIYHVDKALTPDTWLTPQLVAEIAADEISRSSVHTSGFGLRFPRLIKWRPDKTPEQATSIDELSHIELGKGEA